MDSTLILKALRYYPFIKRHLMVHNILLTWVYSYMKPQKQYQKDTKSNAVGKNTLPLAKKG